MHREPGGIWRIDYQLPPGETPEQALQPDSLKARIDAQLAMIGHPNAPWELDWSSVYSARTLTLPDFVHGRVIFTGDAAHLLPIFGVRGANTAFQDAQSLGWHLAYGVKGLAGPALLANHSAERVGAAREIIAESGKSTRFMAPPSAGFRMLRDAVLSLSLQHEFVRPLYHWRTSRPHEYSDSQLNCADDDNALFQSGPAHGAPPRNVRLGDDDFLLDHLGGGFDLLYACRSDVPAPIQEVVHAAAGMCASATASRPKAAPTCCVQTSTSARAGSSSMHRACKRPWPLPCPTEELAMTDRTTPALSIDALEDVYDTLAQAIDQAGPGKAQLLLVKLALLQANAQGDARLFAQQVQAALQDL
jgi:3-(3-hydroxy-phenyl)propionate hydroxylase